MDKYKPTSFGPLGLPVELLYKVLYAEILPQHKTICLKTLMKISAQSNNQVENYARYRKTKQQKILC